MAAFDSIDLRISSGGGAVVELSAAVADSQLQYDPERGGDVVIPAHGHVAIVRGVDSGDHDSSVVAARELAEAALSHVAPQRDVHALTLSGDRPYVCWWTTVEGSTIRITGSPTWTTVSPTWGDKRRSAFELLNPYPANDTPWHAALKHYRASETAAEIEISAANLYLAVASALSARVSKLPNESERHWLLRSLRVVDREVDLSSFAPHDGDKSAPEAIHGELCHVLRNTNPSGLLHALGGNRPSHADVVAAHARYSTMFRQLARVYVGITFPSLDPTESSFATTVRARLGRSVVWIGDERAAGLDAERGHVGEWHPSGARLRLPTRDVTGIAVSSRFAVVGRTSSNAVEAGVGVVRSFGTLEDERVTSVANLPGTLDVRDAAAVEVVVCEPH